MARGHQMRHDGHDFSQSVRTATISWFATMVDQSRGGLDVFDLWRQLFPKHRREIDQVWAKVEPQWKYIRDFRDKVGFHADTPLNFFRARSESYQHQAQIAKALQGFIGLAVKFLQIEDKELPDFVPEVEGCLLDLESLLKVSLTREWFKRAHILRHEP
jgi:hypothetical protein